MPAADASGFANPDLLWTVETLHARLDDPGLRIIDVRVGEAFAMGHIPGARHFSIYSVNTYDTDDAPMKSFVHMWATLLGQRGVTADNTILVYGDIAGMTGARGFWFLEYLGHRDIHLLDGGYDAWTRADLPIARDAERPSAQAFGYDPMPERVATRHDVLAAIGDPDSVILDTRSEKEWLGADRRAARGGAVPGAVHQDWVDHLTPQGEIKPPDELRRQFEALAVTPDKEVIAYCNTGYRSAHAYLVLRLLGYPRVRNYVGSWQEWGNRAELPVVRPTSGVAPLTDR